MRGIGETAHEAFDRMENAGPSRRECTLVHRAAYRTHGPGSSVRLSAGNSVYFPRTAIRAVARISFYAAFTEWTFSGQLTRKMESGSRDRIKYAIIHRSDMTGGRNCIIKIRIGSAAREVYGNLC